MPNETFAASMSDSDALMWSIEKDPVLRTTIVAVALLDRAPDWGRLQERLLAATKAVPRLRQHVIVPPFRLGPPQWVDDPSFDLNFHLRRVALPPDGSFDTVLEMARVAAMGGFDRNRPLWEFTLVEGLPDGQAALIEKVHHTVTDGVGGIRLYGELLDTDREGHERAAPIATDDASGAPPRAASIRELLRRQAAAATVGMSRTAVQAASALLRDPVGAVAAAGRSTVSAIRLLAPVPAPLSPVMLGRSLRWHLDAFDVPLDDLHRAAKAADGSINDAFLAAVAGGLARYHQAHGATVAELRVDIPVNVRAADDPLGGNRFVPVRGPLPMNVADPIERMQQIGGTVRAWRNEPALELVDGLAGMLNRLPAPLVIAIFGEMLKHVDFTASNVPGIPFPPYLAGSEILKHWAFAAPSGTAVNFALLSHVDHACIGINSDSAAIPDPDVLTACLREGFDEVIAVGAERSGR